MSGKRMKFFMGLICIFFLTSISFVGTNVADPGSAAKKYIEVCSKGIVYLPPGTEYVTCRGRIMKVISIVPMKEGARAESGACDCPNCCEGFCGVTVACGPGGLCVAFLDCDD